MKDTVVKKLIVFAFIIASVVGMTGCGGENHKDYPYIDTKGHYSFTDSLGRIVEVTEPKRICTMIGSFTDIWCLAGGRDTLVAAASDSWTSFDLGLGEDVVDIGPVKEPNLELIIASNPDLIICSSNTQADMELMDTFDNLNIDTAYFDVQNISDYLNMLKICTDITRCAENYVTYGENVLAEVNKAKEKADGTCPTILCGRATGTSVKIKGSEDFLLGEMLKDLGCINIADGDTSLLENLSIEAIIKDDPDYIFIVLQGTDPTAAEETLEKALLSNPAWSELSAVKNGRFYTLEHQLYNVKPNEKWGQAYEKLADIIYG